jgi:hypothetical protein
MEQQEPSTYRYGPLERRGWLFGIRGTQFGVVLLGLGGAILVVNLSRSWWGALGAAAWTLTWAGLAFLPVAGRGVDEWAGVTIGYWWRRLRGRDRWHSPYPLMGYRSDEEKARVAPPPTLLGLELLEARMPTGAAGILCDRRIGTYTCLLLVRSSGFLLVDDGERQRRVEAYGAALASICREGSPVSRLQWIEQALPDAGDEPARQLVEETVVPLDSGVVASYRALLETGRPLQVEHEVLLAVTISMQRAGRMIRRSGGGDGAACKVLLNEVHGLASLLEQSELVVQGLATPRRLAAQLRIGFEPPARRWMLWRGAVRAEAEGVEEASAYPLSTEERWSWYRAEGTYHATYWVREMPRQPVGSAWMYSLMLETGSERTVTWVGEPLPPRHAHQRVVRQQVEDVATEDFKARRGFLITRREQEEHAGAERREAELVAGHGLYRYNVYVTVSATSLEQLEERCLHLEQAAARSLLELQRLVGQQAEALTFTLPLGRGLR